MLSTRSSITYHPTSCNIFSLRYHALLFFQGGERCFDGWSEKGCEICRCKAQEDDEESVEKLKMFATTRGTIKEQQKRRRRVKFMYLHPDGGSAYRDLATSNCCAYKSDLITVINVPDLSSETLSETGNIRKCPVSEPLWRKTCRAPFRA